MSSGGTSSPQSVPARTAARRTPARTAPRSWQRRGGRSRPARARSARSRPSRPAPPATPTSPTAGSLIHSIRAAWRNPQCPDGTRDAAREPSSGSSHNDTTDAEGDMRNSLLLRWGVTSGPCGRRAPIDTSMILGQRGHRNHSSSAARHGLHAPSSSGGGQPDDSWLRRSSLTGRVCSLPTNRH